MPRPKPLLAPVMRMVGAGDQPGCAGTEVVGRVVTVGRAMPHIDTPDIDAGAAACRLPDKLRLSQAVAHPVQPCRRRVGMVEPVRQAE